jgi:hypothetical protein
MYVMACGYINEITAYELLQDQNKFYIKIISYSKGYEDHSELKEFLSEAVAISYLTNLMDNNHE